MSNIFNKFIRRDKHSSSSSDQHGHRHQRPNDHAPQPTTSPTVPFQYQRTSTNTSLSPTSPASSNGFLDRIVYDTPRAAERITNHQHVHPIYSNPHVPADLSNRSRTSLNYSTSYFSYDNTTPPRISNQQLFQDPTQYLPPSNHITRSDSACVNVEQDVPPFKYAVGVDFGTTQTGFGFCRISNKKKPSSDDIIANDVWENQPEGTMSCKTPTIMSYHATDRSRKLFSWTAKMQGSDAGFERIERVKLCLEKSIPDAMKPKLPNGITPITAISDFLAWLGEQIQRMISQRYPMDRHLTPNDFLYCFTVPVGWSHHAHESLRKAAHLAGLIDEINSPHLIFCYEPEAAAMACVHESDYEILPGSKMLVVDCGGGTVDLFLASLDENNNLEELTISDGSFLGATRVDANFWTLIRQKVGLTAFERFKSKSEFRQLYTEMEWKWEYFKRQFTGKIHDAFKIQIPPPLAEIMTAEKLDELQHGYIFISETEIRSLFDPVIHAIIEIVKQQLDQVRSNKIRKIEYLYVVGGFGCNAYVRKRVIEDSEVKRYVEYSMLPKRPEAAVLRGAVWCALNHQQIKSRKARKSIGVGVLRKFDPAVDHVSEIIAYDASDPVDVTKAHVSKSVYVYVCKGQSVSYNARYVRKGYHVKSPSQRSVNVCIWSSDSVPDSGSSRLETSLCEMMGNITVQLPPNRTADEVPRFTIEIAYGRVELGIKVVDECSGQAWNQYLNHGHIQIRK